MMDVNDEQADEPPNISGDIRNILLLIFMYVLQFVPRVMSDAISILLQKRNISYADQAGFSLVPYSYCFKVLWAPIVDCLYFQKIGRRKTWILPTQYGIGILLFLISLNFDDWLGSDDGARRPRTHLLGVMFFACVTLTSVQDVAVDGWSLTMLKKCLELRKELNVALMLQLPVFNRRNVGHAGTCNNVGFTIGYFLGFVLLIVLESKDFSNRFRTVPQDHGFVSSAGYMKFWSTAFIISSTLLIFRKDDVTDSSAKDGKLGLRGSYICMWRIIKIAPVLQLSFILLTNQIGLAAGNSVASLKLIDAGVSSDNFAMLIVPSFPFIIIAPFVLSRLIGNRGMRVFTITYTAQSVLNVAMALFIFGTPYAKNEDGMLPGWHYWLLLLLQNSKHLVGMLTSIVLHAFFARVSDPRFGGIYITIFNAMQSIGAMWTNSVCLWLVEPFTIRSCEGDKCSVLIDGYFTEIVLCTLMAVVWLRRARKVIYKLEDMNHSAWTMKDG